MNLPAILRAPSAFMSAMTGGLSSGELDSSPGPVSGAGGGNGGLRLVWPSTPATGQPSEFIGTDAQIAALISGQSITMPAAYPVGFWLEIPARWLPYIATTMGYGSLVSQLPTAGPFQLSQECAVSAGGTVAALLQALGFTSFSPTINGQLPSISA